MIVERDEDAAKRKKTFPRTIRKSRKQLKEFMKTLNETYKHKQKREEELSKILDEILMKSIKDEKITQTLQEQENARKEQGEWEKQAFTETIQILTNRVKKVNTKMSTEIAENNIKFVDLTET